MVSLARFAIVLAPLVLLTACGPLSEIESRRNRAASESYRATMVTDAAKTASAYVAQTPEAPSQVADATETRVPTAPPALAVVSPSLVATPESFMPLIEDFSCTPCAIDPGETATLRWDVTGAIWVTLENRGVEAPGSAVVQPDQTTTYRLIAANENGRSERMVSVEVRGLPVIHHFTCLPCEIRAGESSTLSWDLSGGTAAYLDGQGVTAPGSTVVVPDKTTTYHLEAVSERGSVERLVTVTVIESGDPDRVDRALTELDYRVRSVGHHPLAAGGQSITVVMESVCGMGRQCTAVAAEQYYRGLRVLYDNYPGEPLSVGLYDGVRYTVFVTTEPASVEALLRGEMDGRALWRSGWWNVWDDWRGRWLPERGIAFGQKDFSSKQFVR